MRQFKNCVQMIKEMPREVFVRGIAARDASIQGQIIDSKDFDQKELFGVAYIINNTNDKDEMLEVAKGMFKLEHIRKEVGDKWFDEMISNPTTKEEWWHLTNNTSEYHKKFCDYGNGYSSYGYGAKIIPQLPGLFARLRGNIYARGAYITLFDSSDIWKIGLRVSCTLCYGFSVRKTLNGNEMTMIIHQRSCDLASFFALDVYKAIKLLEYVAGDVGVKSAKLKHFEDSLHS